MQQWSLDREVGAVAFGTDAQGYHQARLPYPDELYRELLGQVRPQPKILEIGAGTGLVTEALLARNPASLTAVEPDTALAEFIEGRLNDSRLKVVNRAFPEVLIEGRFDLIACAAAFHWMDPQAALKRVIQLLAPDGVWAMWWHSYRNPGFGDELADEISPLLEGIKLPPSLSLRRHYALDEKANRQMLEEAGFRSVEYRLYRQSRELTTDEIIALYETFSFVRLLSPDRRGELLKSLRNVVERRFGGRAPNLVLTPLYLAKL
jgi:SAM-dependent methyltransferase